jgi:hypothetical protein
MFTQDEITAIDTLWRDLPKAHVWTGWAASGEGPDVIWLFRTRAHWRRFLLQKRPRGYALIDEHTQIVAAVERLEDLAHAIAAVPSFSLSSQ